MTPVIVTTAHRGIFFGYIDIEKRLDRSLVLMSCRNVIYRAGSKGFLGLATVGPEEGSTIGSLAPDVLLHDITSVSLCTDQAADVFCNWD